MISQFEKSVRFWTLLAIWVTTVSAAAAETVLFDASQGTALTDQGWPLLPDPINGNTVTQSVFADYTRLDTLDPMSDRGGYFSQDPFLGILRHPDMPALNSVEGFLIRFTLRVDVENHVTGPAGDDNGDGLDDRAGISMIALGDNRTGIELGFGESRIWAQDDDLAGSSHLFTQAEFQDIDTTIWRSYKLQIRADRYRLVLDGPDVGPQTVLAGRVRDYANFSGSVDPYEIPSFLFLGDNTTRGESSVDIRYIAVDEINLCDEVDALVAAIAGSNFDSTFDLNADGVVDAGDLQQWLSDAGELFLESGQSFSDGDANLDGVVDGADFLIWNANKFTAVSGWCAGDFTADGNVDGQDFLRWNSNKFQSPVVVPEPWCLPWALLLPLVARRQSGRLRARVRADGR